ncbi:MAG: Fic family protein [Dehalogenimonas sp.]
MKRGLTGSFTPGQISGGERFKSFIPAPLPPEPPIVLDVDLQSLMDQALLALGRLDSVSVLLPDTSLFLYMYIRKEAVLSSQIEGTQSSLSDLLLYENAAAPGVPVEDTIEVSNYVAAMDYGLRRLQEGFPLSLLLIREIHGILLNNSRGGDKQPGDFRTSQNWIGGSRPGNAAFVPPPPDRLMDCLSNLEMFLHDQPGKTPLLIKAALAHLQFETIHPFLDGNGRLGRLLITFILCAENAISQPLLYLSLYLKRHRQEYYDLLQAVRLDGDWERWLAFFLTGVRETADSAVQTARALTVLFDQDQVLITSAGRNSGSVLKVHNALRQRPVLSPFALSRITGLSAPTVLTALETLVGMGIVTELTGRRRDRLYGYKEYISILSQGTEYPA